MCHYPHLAPSPHVAGCSMRCPLAVLSPSLPRQHDALCHQHQVGGSLGVMCCMSVVINTVLYSFPVLLSFCVDPFWPPPSSCSHDNRCSSGVQPSIGLHQPWPPAHIFSGVLPGRQSDSVWPAFCVWLLTVSLGGCAQSRHV